MRTLTGDATALNDYALMSKCQESKPKVPMG